MGEISLSVVFLKFLQWVCIAYIIRRGGNKNIYEQINNIMLPEHKTRKRLVFVSEIEKQLHPKRDWPKLLLVVVVDQSALSCLHFKKVNKHLVLKIILTCLYLVFLRKDVLRLTRAEGRKRQASGLPAASYGPHYSHGGYAAQKPLSTLETPGGPNSFLLTYTSINDGGS